MSIKPLEQVTRRRPKAALPWPRARFEHGVASGDPLTDRVILWTRLTTSEKRVLVRWTIARDAALEDVVAEGTTTARAQDDHTVHVDACGLEAGSTYHFGFAVAGAASPTGRTRTLPADDRRLRFAYCSCAKYNAGFFNAYARIAEHHELDFLLHLGDYIYEASNTPPKSQTPGADIGRAFDPLEECRTLDDYRRRYAQYRRDPDVQRLHERLPMIATLDDHELADGAWAGGSTEHHTADHGPWAARRDAALRARWEWLPARKPDPADPTRVFRGVRVGGLADILLLDIRSRRDEPVREPEMSRPERTMLGAEQRDWLLGELDASAAAWRIIASPSVFTRTWCDAPAGPLQTALSKLKLIDEDGEGPDHDQWDGYPAERARLTGHLLERAIGDVVFLSADIHVGVAAEVADEPTGRPVGVELTAPSLTSQNLDDKLGVPARDPRVTSAEAAYVAAHPHVRWCDMAAHGYVVVDVDGERLRAEWWHVDTVLRPDAGVSLAAAFEVQRGQRELRRAASPGRRSGR
jgi:alkaline phosphatase D